MKNNIIIAPDKKIVITSSRSAYSNRKVLIIIITVALIVLAMIPVRSHNSMSNMYFDRPLIVWIIEKIQENYFIWDPTQ